ncbi:hypothetical protein VVMO6_01090 [Vibrio vulnificus MO6-24/O]|nr:hypothetical protein VVMO6_01090 [Vibrio vulnificus MO6-24/O]
MCLVKGFFDAALMRVAWQTFVRSLLFSSALGIMPAQF